MRLWNSPSTPSPPENGSAVSDTRCYATSPGWSTVNDITTAATTLAARQQRIAFKIIVLVHKALYEGQPVYLASLLNQHTPLRCIWSSSGLLLDVPRINLERFGRRAFAFGGPTLWSKLPPNLRVNGNHIQFKKLLKIYLVSTVCRLLKWHVWLFINYLSSRYFNGIIVFPFFFSYLYFILSYLMRFYCWYIVLHCSITFYQSVSNSYPRSNCDDISVCVFFTIYTV